MLEINYYKSSSTGRNLRRQLLEVADGWTLSNAVEVGQGPESLRGYEGGWQFGSKVYPTRKAAERNLRQNRWHLPGETPAPRNLPRAERAERAAGLVRVDVAVTVEQRDALDAEASRLGLSRTSLVAKYADSLAKRHAKNKTSG